MEIKLIDKRRSLFYIICIIKTIYNVNMKVIIVNRKSEYIFFQSIYSVIKIICIGYHCNEFLYEYNWHVNIYYFKSSLVRNIYEITF